MRSLHRSNRSIFLLRLLTIVLELASSLSLRIKIPFFDSIGLYMMLFVLVTAMIVLSRSFLVISMKFMNFVVELALLGILL